MKFNLDEVKEFIARQSPETKIYIGCDSERFRIGTDWYADYILAIVVHIDGKHGCKLFGEVQRERDYDQKVNRPRFRLMNEAYKLSELYLKLADVLEDRLVKVHLDCVLAHRYRNFTGEVKRSFKVDVKQVIDIALLGIL